MESEAFERADSVLRARWARGTNAVDEPFCEIHIDAMHSLALQVFERLDL